jgi:hypothetical protein
VPDADIAGAMKTRPEGFWFFRNGEINDDEYAADLSERIPALYASRGFIDFRIAKDTLHIDREHGKALLELTVEEGPQYKVGEFEVIGGRHYSDEEVRNYYPFTNTGTPLTSRVTQFLFRRTVVPTDVFNQAAWESATNQVRQAYANDGYIYSQVAPIVERRVTADSQHVVDLRWEVEEGAPAVINRIEIVGNDYTTEYFTLDEIIAKFEEWRQRYPSLIQREQIATSHEGRPVWVYRLHNSTAALPPSAIFYHGLIHAREWISGPVAMYNFESLLKEALASASGWQRITRFEFSVVPVLNPDGYSYSWTNFRLWRKNRRSNGGGSFGVDLNRNYTIGWGGVGSSSNSNSRNSL